MAKVRDALQPKVEWDAVVAAVTAEPGRLVAALTVEQRGLLSAELRRASSQASAVAPGCKHPRAKLEVHSYATLCGVCKVRVR